MNSKEYTPVAFFKLCPEQPRHSLNRCLYIFVIFSYPTFGNPRIPHFSDVPTLPIRGGSLASVCFFFGGILHSLDKVMKYSDFNSHTKRRSELAGGTCSQRLHLSIQILEGLVSILFPMNKENEQNNAP